MSNPNPFVPKGSLLEQQTQRRSRLKLAVFCIVAVGVTGLVAMLIQGCKRDTSTDLNPLPDASTNSSVTDTNLNPPLTTDTNTAPPIYVPPTITNTPPPPPQQPQVTPTVETGGTEYVVVAGDTLGKIAKKNGVSLKALEAANPGVDSKHLKVKQKLTIPPGGTSAGAAPAVSANANATADAGGETTYVVKSGDTLHKIAKKFHVTVKAIETANSLTTTSIKVGKKLKIPGAAEATAPAQPAAAPVPDTTPAPNPQPISSTPPTLTPAPATPAPTK
jgi:LysM repeat protein